MSRLVLLAATAALVALLGFPGAAAQDCKCPLPKTQANFNAENYLGKWYEMHRVPRSFEDDGQCGMAQYSWTDSTNSAINVINSNYVPASSSVTTVNLLAKPADLPNGKFTVTFPTLPAVTGSDYWVLGTDYNTYAVVYSCSMQSTDVIPHVTLWVLARNPSTYTSEVNMKVMKLITDAGLDPSILKPVQHQEGCPAAACTSCPSTKESLDLDKLKGRWWEVQHSPYATGSDTQSCSIAEFSATSDKEIQFSATTYQMSSTSGADKNMNLNATWSDATKKDGSFDISGTAGGKMCVVDTDYESWAVVSICLPPPVTTTAAPVGPVATPTPAVSGGVFVMARKRGLTAKQQMKANKAVVNAGQVAAAMEATPSTPCPAAALDDDAAAGASSATVAPVALLLATAILSLFRPS